MAVTVVGEDAAADDDFAADFCLLPLPRRRFHIDDFLVEVMVGDASVCSAFGAILTAEGINWFVDCLPPLDCCLITIGPLHKMCDAMIRRRSMLNAPPTSRGYNNKKILYYFYCNSYKLLGQPTDTDLSLAQRLIQGSNTSSNDVSSSAA